MLGAGHPARKCPLGIFSRRGAPPQRPEVEKALEAIFQQEGLSIRRIPEKHAGGKWQLRHASGHVIII